MRQEDFEKGRLQLKYHTSNILYKFLVEGFNKRINGYFRRISSNEQIHILEIGVGEGQILEMCNPHFINANIVAADIAPGILDVAKENLKEYSNINYKIEDIVNLSFQNEEFDLIICCEVLEHVPEYSIALKQLNRCLKKGGNLILSVPNEPIWRISNMLRGAYMSNFGNTPGHVNNWSNNEICNLLESHGFEILCKDLPFPWSTFLTVKA